MAATTFPPLDITPIWARVNDELIELLDLAPDDKLDWSPKPELWNLKGILLHVVLGRGLIAAYVQDGTPVQDALQAGQTKEGLKEVLRRSWESMVPFLSDAGLLNREYEIPYEGQTVRLNGHWLAFGQIEHDIHHRADIIHYLGLLGIAHPEPDTIERRLRESLK